MGKKQYYTRKVNRPSNLGTTDAYHKVLMEVYFAKKAGKPYCVSVICDREHVGHINTKLVEKYVSIDKEPTRADAEELRIEFIKHGHENWKGKERAKAEPEVEATHDEVPVLEFAEDLIVKEAEQCNDFGVLEWNGHRYRLVPID